MTFPDLVAQTLSFSLGRARSPRIAPDGSRVLFLRSKSGTDRVHHLWSFDVATGTERLLVDAAALGAGPDAPLSEQERARRERMRDRSAGIGSFGTDAGVHTAVFVVSGHLYAADVATGEVTALDAAEPAAEARIDPTGRTIAYVCDGALHVIGRDGKRKQALGVDESPSPTRRIRRSRRSPCATRPRAPRTPTSACTSSAWTAAVSTSAGTAPSSST
jgi:dipeptidyl-peptidase-4